MSETANDRAGGGRGGAWIGAVILIAIGLVFLFQNLGYPVPGNWWALFLLIPAVAAIASAWRNYRQAGLTAAVVSPLASGLVLAGFALVFLFDLDVNWGLVWPVALILIGVGVLGRAVLK